MKKIILTALFMGILLGGHARNTASPFQAVVAQDGRGGVSYTHLRAHETKQAFRLLLMQYPTTGKSRG